MDVRKSVMGNLKKVLNDRISTRYSPKKEETDVGIPEESEGVNRGEGSESDVYPNPNTGDMSGIPQEGAPEKEMRAHNDPEFSDEERDQLRSLYERD